MLKGRVQPKRIVLSKPSVSVTQMDVCNENSKKYFIFEPEHFREEKTHPGNSNSTSELLFPGCGVTVPRMWSYCSSDVELLFPGCVFSSRKCSGSNIKYFFEFSLQTSICVKEMEGFERTICFGCTLPLSRAQLVKLQ